MRIIAPQPKSLADRPRYGWFVFAPEDTPADFPDDLLAVLKAARAQGAEYALFDCDAVPQQGLTILHPDFHD